MSADFRFDPFNEKFLPVFRTGELHTAKTFPELNGRTGFFLRELPQRRIPSTVSIVGADLSPLSEVSRTITPGVTEFRVDYSQLFFWSSGFVEVHASRAGEQFAAAYYGLGAGLNWSDRNDAKFAFNRSVKSRDVIADSFLVRNSENEYAQQKFSVSPNLSAHGNKLLGVLSDETDANCAATVGIIRSLARGKRRFFFSGRTSQISSATFEPPPGLRFVNVIFCGGGGGGSACINGLPVNGAGGGGGGAPVSYFRVDLDALTPPFTYTVAGPTPRTAFPGSGFAAQSSIFGCSSGRGNPGQYNTITGVGAGGGSQSPTFSGAVVESKVFSATSGANNSGTTSGAGGACGRNLFFPFAFFVENAAAGAAVSGDNAGNDGAFPGCGGSGGGGAITDTLGGGGGGGFILLWF